MDTRASSIIFNNIQRGETVPDPVELGRVIKETMSEGGREVAPRAEEIRRKTEVAMTEANGSFIEDLQRLVKEFGKVQV